MKVTNKSARVVHINTTNGPISIAPLQTLDASGDQASTVREALEGPLKALVDAGELEIDGAPAPASAATPSGGQQNTQNTSQQNTQPGTPGAPSLGPSAQQQPSPSAPQNPEPEPTSSRRSNRG